MATISAVKEIIRLDYGTGIVQFAVSEHDSILRRSERIVIRRPYKMEIWRLKRTYTDGNAIVHESDEQILKVEAHEIRPEELCEALKWLLGVTEQPRISLSSVAEKAIANKIRETSDEV